MSAGFGRSMADCSATRPAPGCNPCNDRRSRVGIVLESVCGKVAENGLPPGAIAAIVTDHKIGALPG